MIIRSQDKKRIINLDSIICLQVKAKSIYSNDDLWIGTYSTEEKAIKVLDMITMRYYKANQYFESSGFVENVVFQMPADEDVEV